jgi:putative photosynthetic complex assembly protein 2
MSDYALPIGFALFCWWFGTGLVFLTERGLRGRPTAVVVGAIAGLSALAVYGIAQSSQELQAGRVYLGFASSIVLWGALELSFLTGLITGAQVTVCTPVCAPACRGWRHFGHAVLALLYHELALAFCALAVATLCWNQPNPCAAWTFGLLWVMREGAKLNLFLGVRNPAAELLPQRLAHLARYFGKRQMNPLLPLSILAATLAEIWLVRQVILEATTRADRIAGLLLATLLALAIVEYLVLVLPVRADALWTWATRRNGRIKPPGGAAASRIEAVEPVRLEGAPAAP